jgi:pimeloyl-ACP methyl ester carboxylesterase
MNGMEPSVVGDGPIRVLALHGWFGSAAAWASFADLVDTEQFSYAFMDCRGYGTRKHELGSFSMDEIAHDAIQAADALGWEHFDLMGHSMGGKAIQRVLLKVPERVGRLVAITPVPACGVSFDASTRALFESAAANPEARQGIIAHSVGGRLSASWVRRMARHSLENSTEKAFAGYLRAWADDDFADETLHHPATIKVIVGRHDPSITEALMRSTYLASYPQADLEIMENAGHYPMDEIPVALVTSVERFLRQVHTLQDLQKRGNHHEFGRQADPQHPHPAL